MTENDINHLHNEMKPTACILVDGVKQRFYFNDTVFLVGDTEFEIEFNNKSQRTVVAVLTINGESLIGSPVIYNGHKVILKDYIFDKRKFLFVVYEIDSNDEDVKKAIKENGILSIEYYYERQIEKESIKPTHSESYNEGGSTVLFSLNTKNKNDSMISNNLPLTSENDLEEETGKIIKGSPSNETYASADIELDSINFDTQVIKLLPLSKKPNFIVCPQCQYQSNIEAFYCKECGHKY